MALRTNGTDWFFISESLFEFIGRTLIASDAVVDFIWEAQRFSIISLFIWKLVAATDDVDLYVRVSTDGSTFDTTGYSYDTQVMDGATRNNESSTSAAQWLLNETAVNYGLGNAVGDFFSGRIDLYLNNLAPEQPHAAWRATMKPAGISAPATVIGGGGQSAGNSSWEGIRLLLSSGNLATGLVTAVGIR